MAVNDRLPVMTAGVWTTQNELLLTIHQNNAHKMLAQIRFYFHDVEGVFMKHTLLLSFLLLMLADDSISNY